MIESDSSNGPKEVFSELFPNIEQHSLIKFIHLLNNWYSSKLSKFRNSLTLSAKFLGLGELITASSRSSLLQESNH